MICEKPSMCWKFPVRTCENEGQNQETNHPVRTKNFL